MIILSDPRRFLSHLFDKAVEAADPYQSMLAHIPSPPKGRLVVIGAGKAASQMAAAFERAYEGPLQGVVVARHGPVEACRSVRVMTAAHPVPDAAGLAGANAVLEAVSGLTQDDLVVALISGGGSALLPAPPSGFALEDEIAVNQALLRSGAPISAMNVVRKHFSRIKGGRLAEACAPARVISLIVSDVPGDDPAMVASGPTLPEGSDRDAALRIIRDYRIALDPRIVEAIAQAKAPTPADPAFAHNIQHVVASAGVSLDAAAAAAKAAGIEAVILSDAIEGEARDIGLMHAAIAREVAARNRPFSKPVVILSGGETTVSIGGGPAGKGGRNSEFLLSFALAIEGIQGIHALAADTDGIDGSEDNAGAFCDGETCRLIRENGGDARAYLAAHDAWSAFNLAKSLFMPGPTGTNVNDFRAILMT